MSWFHTGLCFWGFPPPPSFSVVKSRLDRFRSSGRGTCGGEVVAANLLHVYGHLPHTLARVQHVHHPCTCSGTASETPTGGKRRARGSLQPYCDCEHLLLPQKKWKHGQIPDRSITERSRSIYIVRTAQRHHHVEYACNWPHACEIPLNGWVRHLENR